MEESKDARTAAQVREVSEKLDSYDEEYKSPEIKKATNITGRADDVSNISTQRASQVMNRFTS